MIEMWKDKNSEWFVTGCGAHGEKEKVFSDTNRFLVEATYCSDGDGFGDEVDVLNDANDWSCEFLV
jgi:hypothetical protein